VGNSEKWAVLTD